MPILFKDMILGKLNDVDDYLKFFLEGISYNGELRLDAIESMAKYKLQGGEYVQCSFDPTDEDYNEDYKEGYVTLYFYKECGVEKDTIIWVENKKFYDSLVELYNNTVNFLKKERLGNNLLIIKQYLNL